MLCGIHLSLLKLFCMILAYVIKTTTSTFFFNNTPFIEEIYIILGHLMCSVLLLPIPLGDPPSYQRYHPYSSSCTKSLLNKAPR